MGDDRESLPCSDGPQRGEARPGVAGDVVTEMHAGGSGLVHEAGDLRRPFAPPDDQGAAQLSQRRIQIGEALDQEVEPVRSPARAGQECLVDDEDRHHVLGRRGRGQGRVVADPEIAREDHELGTHPPRV